MSDAEIVYPGFVLRATPIKKGPHCWEDGPRHPADGMSTTCMLHTNHKCPHRWWRNDDVSLALKPAKVKS